MNGTTSGVRSLSALLFLFSAMIVPVSASLPDAGSARTSLDIDAGLAVVVGTEDGVFESSLHNGGKVLVHSLTTDPVKCAQARKHLLDNQLYGLASVELVDGFTRLPYYENLANFLIADLDELSAKGLTKTEVMRVLAYDGKAYLREGGSWTVLHKPIPAGAGEHTHFFADAGKSNIIDDTLAGPPNAYRFVGKPASRSDDNGHRVGKNIVFYRAGKGRAQKHPDGPERLEPEMLFAKDAFSGVFLWSRQIGDCAREWGVVGEKYFWVWNHLTDYDSLYLDAVDVKDGSTVHRLPIFRGNWLDRDKRKTEPFDTASSFRGRMALFAADGLLGHTFIGKLWIRDEASANEKWSKSLEPGLCYRTVLCSEGVVVAVVSEHGNDPSLSRADPFVSIIGYDLQNGDELWRIDGDELWKDSDFGPTTEKPVITVPWMSGANEGQVAFPAWRIPADEVGNPKKEYDVLFSLLTIETGDFKWQRTESFQNKLSHVSWYYDYYVKADRVLRCLLEWGEVWNRETGEPMDEASWPNKI